MPNWVLILIVFYGNAPAVESIPFKSERACKTTLAALESRIVKGHCAETI